MDPESGRIARLHMDSATAAGSAIDPRDAVPADAAAAELIDEMIAKASYEGRKPTPLIAVDEDVVQKLRLGEKELRRRKQRRR